MQQDVIHIAFCVNDAYAQYISVTIKSIIENHHNCDIYIHVLTDYISNSNRAILYETIKDFCNVSLHIYEIDDTPLQGLETGHWNIYAWYRLLIPNTLSNEIKKVLYLDADTLVVSSLNMLFSINMENKSIAAAEDIYSHCKEVYHRLEYDCSKKYICTGVMLMNLDYWRTHNLTNKMIDWARQQQERIKYPDQDTINFICQDIKIVLPLRYGVMHCFCEYDMFYKAPFREQFEQCIDNPAIIHYNGCIPWGREYHKHVMHYEWEKYNRMLRQPIRRTYQAKGWMKLKIMCWDLLHLYQGRRRLTITEVKERLFNS